MSGNEKNPIVLSYENGDTNKHLQGATVQNNDGTLFTFKRNAEGLYDCHTNGSALPVDNKNLSEEAIYRMVAYYMNEKQSVDKPVVIRDSEIGVGGSYMNYDKAEALVNKKIAQLGNDNSPENSVETLAKRIKGINGQKNPGNSQGLDFEELYQVSDLLQDAGKTLKINGVKGDVKAFVIDERTGERSKEIDLTINSKNSHYRNIEFPQTESAKQK